MRGEGAELNGTPIGVSQVTRVADAHVLYAGMKTFLRPPRKRGRAGAGAEGSRTRGFGDFWGHVLVARGAAEIMMEPELNVWDYAAHSSSPRGRGRVTTLDGSPTTDGGSVLTTNGILHGDVLRRLAAP